MIAREMDSLAQVGSNNGGTKSEFEAPKLRQMESRTRCIHDSQTQCQPVSFINPVNLAR